MQEEIGRNGRKHNRPGGKEKKKSSFFWGGGMKKEKMKVEMKRNEPE